MSLNKYFVYGSRFYFPKVFKGILRIVIGIVAWFFKDYRFIYIHIPNGQQYASIYEMAILCRMPLMGAITNMMFDCNLIMLVYYGLLIGSIGLVVWGIYEIVR